MVDDFACPKTEVLAQIREDVAYCRAKIEAHNHTVERLLALEEKLADIQKNQGERLALIEGRHKTLLVIIPVCTAIIVALMSIYLG